MKKIPYSKQFIDLKDLTYVNQVLKSENLTKGNQTIKFEKKVNSFCRSKYSLAVVNASNALLLACKVLQIDHHDIVWTTAVTYIASINCALHCKANIDLVDIDYNTNNISLEKLQEKLVIAKSINKLPTLIVLVHLGGLPCDLKEIYQLSKIYNFKIIEDASHAFGSKYLKKRIGNCQFSDLTIFSFHPVKNITSAEGGMITTNNKIYYNKLIELRENGQTFDGINSKKFPTFYDIKELGFNSRINEINSTLGCSQISKINLHINKKKRIVNEYYKELKKVKEIILPIKLNDRESALHLYIIKIKFNELKINKFNFINLLKKEKIFVNTHYIPLFKFTLLKSKIKNKFNYKNSNKYYDTALSLPIYPQMSRAEQKKVINKIKEIIKKYRYTNS
jgi:dTDP-4-amino-4,6-dideoxygalactose transaminase